MKLSIATWNVNSIKQRLDHLAQWVGSARPDIILLQELKCQKEAFSYMEVEELGYNIALVGEKSYNGVAILSKFPLEDICECLPGNEQDLQARYIEAVVSIPPSQSSSLKGKGGGALRIASVYVPNGQEVDSEKFRYKLAFFERLQARMKELLKYEEMLVIGGDYNVAPAASDVYDPVRLEGSICFHPKERAAFYAMEHLGMFDAYRLCHPSAALATLQDEQGFTWWDYRANGWLANKGMRIDHLLISAQAADCLKTCEVHKDIRALDHASDHAPVMAVFEV